MLGGKRASIEPLVALVDEYIIGASIIVIILYSLYKLQIISFTSFLILSLVLVGIIMLVTWRIVVVYKRQAFVGPESLIGREAVVVEPLTPYGMVEVEGELWRAVSYDGSRIGKGSRVRIVDYKGLTLIVKGEGNSSAVPVRREE